jgi:hypothetical protein
LGQFESPSRNGGRQKLLSGLPHHVRQPVEMFEKRLLEGIGQQGKIRCSNLRVRIPGLPQNRTTSGMALLEVHPRITFSGGNLVEIELDIPVRSLIEVGIDNCANPNRLRRRFHFIFG